MPSVVLIAGLLNGKFTTLSRPFPFCQGQSAVLYCNKSKFLKRMKLLKDHTVMTEPNNAFLIMFYALFI